MKNAATCFSLHTVTSSQRSLTESKYDKLRGENWGLIAHILETREGRTRGSCSGIFQNERPHWLSDNTYHAQKALMVFVSPTRSSVWSLISLFQTLNGSSLEYLNGSCAGFRSPSVFYFFFSPEKRVFPKRPLIRANWRYFERIERIVRRR